MQQGMVAALHDDQDVPRQVLAGNEPGGFAGAWQASNPEAAALAEGIALESPMLADDSAFHRFYRAGTRRQPRRDEFAERTLADETDTGRIPLAGDRQASFARNGAYFRLAQPADREFAG